MIIYKGLMKISIISLIFVAVSISLYLFASPPKPDKFVLDYLNTRYTNTDYTNISEKAEQQKPYLESSLINSNFMFGKFDVEIKYFAEQKYIIEKAEFNVYNIQKQSESTNVFARIYFNVKSENIPEWSQLSYYDLQFILSKEKGGYKLSDVIVLDYKYQIPQTINEHVHDENCTHR